MKKSLIISAPRRSGTTAVWSLFRNLPGYVAYDEPFNPKLELVPFDHWKGTWKEFNDLYYRDQQLFNRYRSRITPGEEADDHLPKNAVQYLDFLKSDGPVVIDSTRLGFKFRHFRKHSTVKDYVWVNLSRNPIDFAKSHLMPSENIRIFRSIYYKGTFQFRKNNFNAWGVETAVESKSFLGLIDKVGITPTKSLKQLRASECLLLYWLAWKRYADVYGVETFGNDYLHVRYEQIIQEPRKHLKGIMQRLDLSTDYLNFEHLRKRLTKKSFMKEDHWLTACQTAGFTNDEIDSELWGRYE